MFFPQNYVKILLSFTRVLSPPFARTVDSSDSTRSVRMTGRVGYPDGVTRSEEQPQKLGDVCTEFPRISAAKSP